MSNKTVLAAFASTLAALAYAGSAAADQAAQQAFPAEGPAQVYLTYSGTEQPARAWLVDSDGSAHATVAQASGAAQEGDKTARYDQAESATAGTR